MKRIVSLIMIVIPLIVYSGDNKTHKVGNVSSVNNLTVTGDLCLAKWALSDTFGLQVYPNGKMDTIMMVATASWALSMDYDDFHKEYEKVMAKGELCLPLKEGKIIKNYYRLKKPYTSADVQLQAEIEKLYRRVYEMNKRLEALENKRMKKIKYYKAL
jgi:hypothetical protein